MAFRISASPVELFSPLFGLEAALLTQHGAVPRIADRTPGFPCRVSLRDAAVGETVLLLNYQHHDVATPFRASHAIYVRQNAEQASPEIDEVPDLLRSRLLSVRGFDADGMMVAADAVDGRAIEPAISTMFTDSAVAYLHLHYAKPGCFAARVDRADGKRGTRPPDMVG